ncbi:hypothetical protein [Methylobacter sp.]|uniref:hypothetical protein n=1 Tax=Methylobacter sp. TaxID=2051955 RepID=UPI0024883164|nr:hypothetical protein [Methylobacter sp.]MDI1276048.1 hypothetical protein [Methylobacter sp.]MDI1356882.1 hypothetical protein [Methylobacter sp.]
MSQNNTPTAASNPQLVMLFVNNTGLPDEQVFITFQDPSQSLIATYGGGTSVGRVNTGDMMTQSLDLATIGAGGLSIANAEGPVVFVSYAATEAYNGFVMSGDLSGNAQPSYIGSGGANYLKAYQPFEIDYVAGATNGQGNLTNINYFAAPICIQSYNGGSSGTLLQTRGYYKGTAAGTKRLASEFQTLTAGSALATPIFSENILRYIGPSSYGAGANPYPTFDAYLKSLFTANQSTTIQNSNAFNTQQNPAAGNINYNYAFDFIATVAADNTITLTGTITTTIIKFGEKAIPGTIYTGAVMTISPTIGTQTSDSIFNNTIYGQADPLGSGNGSTTFNSVWAQLATDMAAAGLFVDSKPKDGGSGTGTAYGITQSLAIGEITTGLLGGFPGSGVTYEGGIGTYASYNGQLYKDVPSAAWWNSSIIPSPSVLQPSHPFYNTYAQQIFDATSNQVYSIPFSDRFGDGPLMQTQLYNDKVVDTWVVTLGAPIFMSSKKGLYATSGNGINSTIYTLDNVTGDASLLLTVNFDLVDIAAYGETLYAITSDQFLTIDLKTGTCDVVGSLGIEDKGAKLAVASNGTIYCIATPSGCGTGLYTINQSTGAGTLIGVLGANPAGGANIPSFGMAFDANDNLFGALTSYNANSGQTSVSLMTVNPSTGQAQPLNSSIGFNSLAGMAFYDNSLYGVTADGKLISINVASGAGSLIGDDNIDFRGMTAY